MFLGPWGVFYLIEHLLSNGCTSRWRDPVRGLKIVHGRDLHTTDKKSFTLSLLHPGSLSLFRLPGGEEESLTWVMSSGKLLVEGRRPRTCCGICIQWPAFSCFWYLVHDIELTLCCFQCPPTKICSQSELFISLLSKWATFHSVPSDTFLFELTLMSKYEKDSICWIINSLKWTLFSYKSILETWN